ncbi:CBN-NHR-33 protein [Aphelenchoides bicaudatus]|nr:CBN-NHR-33 protein [Aphelenchoides bicaudatus]
MSCEVCGLTTDGKHFGKLVCRPCSGFFRRTVVHKLKYKCKTNGNCVVLKELRKACSFCRFEKCKSIGMSAEHIQLNRDKNGPLKKSKRLDIVSPSNSSNNGSPVDKEPCLDSSTLSSSSRSLVLLDKLQDDLVNYMQSEKFLHYMLYPETSSQVFPSVHVKHDEFINMERGCLPLLQNLIAQWCPIYKQLPMELKVAILRGFHHIFMPIYCCYLNALYGDCETKFITHYGQYISIDDSFYDVDDNPKFAWESIKVCCHRYTRLCKEMKEQNIRQSELAAILTVGLCNEVGVVFKSDIMSAFRSQTYDELHADVEKHYPKSEIAPRIAFLSLILLHADLMSTEEKESITMRKLVNRKNIMDIFDE